MKKEHRLFIIQLVIAVALFLGLSFMVKKAFMSDPKAQSYLEFNEGVKKMASSTYALVDSLIATNDLTFDPTSGKDIDKVLNNLKYTDNKKLLIVGSSQMRVVQGEEIQDAYQSLVSRKIERYNSKGYSTYNLSLGGMTTKEKLIMTTKGTEIINPERVLVSVTPWDCLSDKLRPSIKAIQGKTYASLEKTDEVVTKEATNTGSDEVFPLNINSQITETVDKIVEDNIDIYSKRAAIKTWLSDKTTKVLKGIKDGTEATEEVFKTNLPLYWFTVNQDLDNLSGWVSETAQSGKKSIKIVNKDPQNAKWLGNDIILDTPTDTFEFEGWSKAENVSSSTKLYCIDFQVIFEDGTSKWHYKGLTFNKGTHDWEKVTTRVRFDKKVKSIKPHVLFYGGTGTVWFDQIIAKPLYDGVLGDNVLPNSDFEEELKERQNVTYTYTTAEWKRIEQNMFAVVDHIAGLATKEQNVLLFTPFWHHNEKTAYPQKAQYNNLVETVKKYCEQKNVAFVDASYILTKDNFGIYTKGSVRDKIDVLHFNADAHEKLAKYIIKELNL
ncbi:hypothetical protein C8N46_10684 [Kordia periserrulae]|uniref:Uncharacterized protein n=1 Tax=Kordia periserrulae TaxID=701523 RepID=A0A2T6BWI7_9FLAO|nr:hypothetical protein [Kordia periserrulae]PTX60440.1 hypothetical protein C8N46_10684 [Kordia periserrulae]